MDQIYKQLYNISVVGIAIGMVLLAYIILTIKRNKPNTLLYIASFIFILSGFVGIIVERNLVKTAKIDKDEVMQAINREWVKKNDPGYGWAL